MPLDADIARIIPLMPLQDVPNLTPVNARESMRALAAARNDIPLPQPGSVDDASLPGPGGERKASSRSDRQIWVVVRS